MLGCAFLNVQLDLPSLSMNGQAISCPALSTSLIKPALCSWTLMTQGPSATQGVSASHWQCTVPKVLLVAGWMSGEKAPLFIFSCCISSCAFLLKPSFVMLSSCCNIKRNCQIIWRLKMVTFSSSRLLPPFPSPLSAIISAVAKDSLSDKNSVCC